MGRLHVFFLPMMAYGHMIPILDMAKLFASHGVKSTIVTTPLNAPVFSKTVETGRRLGFQLSLQIIKFSAIPGIPEGCENTDQLTSDEMFSTFFGATIILREQVEKLLDEFRPNCLIADMFFPWATDSAAKFNIPRLVFHGTSFFALRASEQVRLHKPFENLSNDSDTFVVSNLPHEIKLTALQISPQEKIETDFTKVLTWVKESELTSYGVVVNSFHELEPDYADHYRNVLNRKAWHIGPLSLCDWGDEDKAQRGKKTAIDEDEYLKWLDSKNPNSVIYVCLGSLCHLPSDKLYELAMGLEASGQDFIWVVRKGKNEEETWMPEGFEEKIKGKGLIIRGWAPQVLILDHQAIGGFVTHCGWNSTLEGISVGVPMVTWPMFAEQFYNEKLVTQIWRTGVAVGALKWDTRGCDSVKREKVEAAVRQLMVGEEAEERRSRAKALKEMARKAVKEGGSSYKNLDDLMNELSFYRS